MYQASAMSGESRISQPSASRMPKKKCRKTAAMENSMASMGGRLRRVVSVMLRRVPGSEVEGGYQKIVATATAIAAMLRANNSAPFRPPATPA